MIRSCPVGAGSKWASWVLKALLLTSCFGHGVQSAHARPAEGEARPSGELASASGQQGQPIAGFEGSKPLIAEPGIGASALRPAVTPTPIVEPLPSVTPQPVVEPLPFVMPKPLVEPLPSVRPSEVAEQPTEPVPVQAAVGASPFATFYRALRGAQGGGKARILFYGDSHTAADFMTGRLRDRLQERFGDGGPGFVITGKPWRSYRHNRVEFTAVRGLRASYVRARPESELGLELGLAGVALEAHRSRPALVRLQVRAAAAPSGDAVDYELSFLKRPGGGSLQIALDGKRVAAVSTAAKRRAPGYLRFSAQDDASHEVEIRTLGDGPVTLFGLSTERDAPGIVLDTLGIPGARARAQLFWRESHFREQVRRRAPDLVVIAYGTNESTDSDQPIEDYERSLRQVVTRIRAASGDASCLLVGPTDFPEKVGSGAYQPRERTAQIIRLQKRLASELGCGFFDTVAATGGPLSMLRWAAMEPPLGARDLIHYTRRGYAAIADGLCDALLARFDASPASSPPPRK